VPALTVLNIERFTSCSEASLVPSPLPYDLPPMPSAFEFFGLALVPVNLVILRFGVVILATTVIE
jgi:hypothetical protein